VQNAEMQKCRVKIEGGTSRIDERRQKNKKGRSRSGGRKGAESKKAATEL